MNDLRCVIDSNVIISALLFPQSIPGRAFSAVIDRDRLLISHGIVHELDEVLSREKFRRYVTRVEVECFLEALVAEGELVEVSEEIDVCRDAKDNHVLELAVSGRASVIITGDRDLLALNPFRGIRVLTPHEFLDAAGS